MTDETNEIDFAAWRTFEHAGWERAADAYDDKISPVTRQAIDPLMNEAHVGAGMHLLDVATGPGYAAAAAGGRGAQVVGIDFSERMIERAWWRFPGIEFRKADAENLPFSDSVFDSVISNFGILHFGNPDKALAEAHRVLVIGGRVAFTAWRTDDPRAGFGLIHDVVQSVVTAEIESIPKGAPFARFGDPTQARAALESLGYHDVSSRDLTLTWRMESADDLFESLFRGGVRVSALLQGQPKTTLVAVRKQFAEDLKRYERRSAIEFPMPVTLTSATKR